MTDEATRRLFLENTGATQEQVDKAEELAAVTGESLGAILEMMGAITLLERARCLAAHMGVPFVDLEAAPPRPELAALVPAEIQRQYQAVPVSVKVTLAMANPLAVFHVEEIGRETGFEVSAALATEEGVKAALSLLPDHGPGTATGLPSAPEAPAAAAVEGAVCASSEPEARAQAISALPDDLPSEIRAFLEIVLEDTTATEADVAQALVRWAETGEHVGRALVAQGAILEAERVRCLGRQWGIDFIDLSSTEPDSTAVGLVPRYQLERGPAIPVLVDEEKKVLYLAMADPMDLYLIDTIQATVNYRVHPLVAVEEDIRRRLQDLASE